MSDTSTVEIKLCGHTRHGVDCVQPVNADGHHHGEHIDADGRTGHNYGPLDYYEITWASGHIETVPAHQVTHPQAGLAMAGFASISLTPQSGPPRVQIHAELNGRWRLVLSAVEEDIRTMRLVTGGERL